MPPFSFPARAVLLCALLACGACYKPPGCHGGNEEHGIITAATDITCGPRQAGDQFVVTSDSALLQLFPAGPGCTLPPIDFNVHSLLGLYTTGDCEVRYIRDVSRIDAEQRYHYRVTVNDCGLCKKMGTSYNWVLVPRLPAGWQVTFETAHD